MPVPSKYTIALLNADAQLSRGGATYLRVRDHGGSLHRLRRDGRVFTMVMLPGVGRATTEFIRELKRRFPPD